MKSRTLTIAVVALTVAALAATFVYADPHGRRGDHGGLIDPLGHLMAVRAELDLSDAQVEQIKSIFADLRTQNAPYRDQMRGSIHQAAAALLANPNDIAGAQAIVDRQTTAENALKTNTIQAVSKAFSILTPEQRVKLATIARQHMARRGGRMTH